MSPTVSTAPGPLQRVLAALAAGAESRAELAARAGLPRDVTDAALEHLVRMGRVVADPLGGGCPDRGCGACPSGRADGEAGCGTGAPGHSRGPVALSLRPLSR